MKNLVAAGAGVYGFLSCSVSVFGQPEPAATPEQILVESTTTSSLQFGIYLLFLFAILAAGLYMLKRGRLFGLPATSGRKLLISETRSLGNRQFLLVVEYESSRMLLGVSPGKIDYLSPLDRAPDFAAALEAQPQIREVER